MIHLHNQYPAVFEPLATPSRYRVAHGGRGSAKSHFFAGQLIRRHGFMKGCRSVCIREVQKDLSQSSKKLLESKIEGFGLRENQGWKIRKSEIETPGGGLIIFQGMQDHTADSIKSLEGFDTAWCEEAQTLSQNSLDLLRPTIRKDPWGDYTGSELWFSFNPKRASDPVDKLFRGPNPPTGTAIVQANWRHNPWFPEALNQERLDCLENEPEKYDHIWEGGYAKVLKGAYFAQGLEEAEREHRIGFVAKDPILPLRAFWDIGGTSRKSDATAIWIVQFVGQEVRVLDYYEAIGQPMAAHLHWLRNNGYGPEDCELVFPHDGAKHDIVHQVTPIGAAQQAGWKATTMPNAGPGAAMLRVNSVRRLMPRVRFNEATTKIGREALGYYHAHIDDKREADMGPVHDWSSHGADAFGGMALFYWQRIEDEKGRGLTTAQWDKPMEGVRGIA